MQSFVDLKQALRARAEAGEILFGIDIKPQFSDTPNNWEESLESIFVSNY